MSIVVLIGNGLSSGFDPRLTTKALTERVLERLGPDYVQALSDLAELASPDDVDHPLGVDRGNFEKLAGPVDRIAEAMTAIEALTSSSDAAVLAGLRTASSQLRSLYLRIVGSVLAEVDACCTDHSGDSARKDAWSKLNAFAGKLCALHDVERSAVFTTNYDSLLMSALLETGRTIYDGFAGGTLNIPLDRWSGTMALYHLHGSVAWVRDESGLIEKPKLEYVRAIDAIEQWAVGETADGWPSVVLGDLKTRQVARHPFTLFYGELRAELATARLAVIGGYSFGDTPLNRELASFLAKAEDRRLVVWSRRPDAARVLDRLQVQLLDVGAVIKPEQIEALSVELPGTEGVDTLIKRIGEGRPSRRPAVAAESASRSEPIS
jgi:hypothetical protein